MKVKFKKRCNYCRCGKLSSTVKEKRKNKQIQNPINRDKNITCYGYGTPGNIKSNCQICKQPVCDDSAHYTPCTKILVHTFEINGLAARDTDANGCFMSHNL